MDENPHIAPNEEADPAAVRAALEAILVSQPFRTSKQCQGLLRHIVERSLHSDDAALRERILGMEVFGRPPDYDTSEDPVVRMRAADVRKRLAQYYQALEDDAHTLHIELRPGSYRAAFRYGRAGQPGHPPDVFGEGAAILVPDQPSQKEASLQTAMPPTLEHRDVRSHRWFASWRAIALLLALVITIGGVWRFGSAHWTSRQKRFWAPLMQSRYPVLLYLGSNVAYRFTTSYLDRYQKEHGLKQNGPEFYVDLPKNGVIQTSDLVAVPSTFVTVGDLTAAMQMVSLMNGWSKPFTLRSADDLTMGDLRNMPVVLIGGFNNRWTLETTDDLPFSFRQGTRIEDRDHPDRRWSVNPVNAGGNTEDYALVSRLLQSKTGGPLLTVSGIGSFGTQAAAEFVSSEEKMNELLKSAPDGWEHKNMQAVLRIKVIGYAPVGVEVVATSYW